MTKKLIFIFLATALLSGSDIAPVYKVYQKALLLKSNGKVLRSDDLEPNVHYFFQYPYRSTPVMLVKNEELDENNATQYVLHAYMAINPNTYEYTNNDVSIVSFYKNDVFGNDVVRFCDDKSTYDIQTGQNVKDTNTTHFAPLVTIKLQEENGKIYATAVSDINVIDGMFKSKHEALTKRFRSMWNAKIKYEKPRVLRYDQFSIVTVKCNEIVPAAPIENNISNEMNQSVETVKEEVEG